LLENDQHWDNTLTEATETRHAHQVRTLFSIVLTTSALSHPKDLWEKPKENMSKNIYLRARRDNPGLDVQYSEGTFSMEH